LRTFLRPWNAIGPRGLPNPVITREPRGRMHVLDSVDKRYLILIHFEKKIHESAQARTERETVKVKTE